MTDHALCIAVRDALAILPKPGEFNIILTNEWNIVTEPGYPDLTTPDGMMLVIGKMTKRPLGWELYLRTSDNSVLARFCRFGCDEQDVSEQEDADLPRAVLLAAAAALGIKP